MYLVFTRMLGESYCRQLSFFGFCVTSFHGLLTPLCVNIKSIDSVNTVF